MLFQALMLTWQNEFAFPERTRLAAMALEELQATPAEIEAAFLLSPHTPVFPEATAFFLPVLKELADPKNLRRLMAFSPLLGSPIKEIRKAAQDAFIRAGAQKQMAATYSDRLEEWQGLSVAGLLSLNNKTSVKRLADKISMQTEQWMPNLRFIQDASEGMLLLNPDEGAIRLQAIRETAAATLEELQGKMKTMRDQRSLEADRLREQIGNAKHVLETLDLAKTLVGRNAKQVRDVADHFQQTGEVLPGEYRESFLQVMGVMASEDLARGEGDYWLGLLNHPVIQEAIHRVGGVAAITQIFREQDMLPKAANGSVQLKRGLEPVVNPMVRQQPALTVDEALTALREGMGGTVRAVNRLLPLLTEGDLETREKVRAALAAVGADSPLLTGELRLALDGDKISVIKESMAQLASLNQEDAIPWIMPYMGASPKLRDAAYQALKALGANHEEIILGVMKAMQLEPELLQKRVQLFAELFLPFQNEMIPRERAQLSAILLNELKATPDEIAAAYALHPFAPEWSDAVPFLNAALAQFTSSADIPKLRVFTPLLGSHIEALRKTAQAAFVRTGAIETMKEAYRDHVQNWKSLSTRAAWELQDKSAVRALIKAIEVERGRFNVDWSFITEAARIIRILDSGEGEEAYQTLLADLKRQLRDVSEKLASMRERDEWDAKGWQEERQRLKQTVDALTQADISQYVPIDVTILPEYQAVKDRDPNRAAHILRVIDYFRAFQTGDFDYFVSRLPGNPSESVKSAYRKNLAILHARFLALPAWQQAALAWELYLHDFGYATSISAIQHEARGAAIAGQILKQKGIPQDVRKLVTGIIGIHTEMGWVRLGERRANQYHAHRGDLPLLLFQIHNVMDAAGVRPDQNTLPGVHLQEIVDFEQKADEIEKTFDNWRLVKLARPFWLADPTLSPSDTARLMAAVHDAFGPEEAQLRQVLRERLDLTNGMVFLTYALADMDKTYKLYAKLMRFLALVGTLQETPDVEIQCNVETLFPTLGRDKAPGLAAAAFVKLLNQLPNAMTAADVSRFMDQNPWIVRPVNRPGEATQPILFRVADLVSTTPSAPVATTSEETSHDVIEVLAVATGETGATAGPRRAISSAGSWASIPCWASAMSKNWV
jgi:hypothetical protein